MTYPVGSRIYFEEEVRPYNVQAAGERYLVCTKPCFGSVLYTVVDLVEQVRGTENLIFCGGAETRELCEEMLDRLEGAGCDNGTWHTEVSHRNRILLKIREKK